MTEHIQSHVFIRILSVDKLIRDAEAVRASISELEAGNLKIDHVKTVFKNFLDPIVVACLQRSSPVDTDLFCGIHRGFAEKDPRSIL